MGAATLSQGRALAVEISSVNPAGRGGQAANELDSLEADLRKIILHQWRVVESPAGDLAAPLGKGQPLDSDQRSAG